MIIESAGSVCSGIGAAPYALDHIEFKWFAEIEEFQSNVLKYHYPNVNNFGDMIKIPNLLNNKKISDVDLVCGGTPCQSFSLAGLKEGLKDERGNLTLEFLKIVEENDNLRLSKNKKRGFVLWENVEGIFSDKTNAFGIFLSGLAGLDDEIPKNKIQKSGVLKGPKRNIAWRILDAKFFGIPQQRKRVFVLASDKNFFPENILFEKQKHTLVTYPKSELSFKIDDIDYQIFREYTDTLYSAYGTKWNGNSAAYNGSLFVVEDNKIRRLSPLECERLMGFPDGYTNITGASRTKRYQSTGNSWPVPVIKWIGNQLEKYNPEEESILKYNLNKSDQPNDVKIGNLENIISSCDIKQLYLSPVGAAGILRRKDERKINMNFKLQKHLENTKEKMCNKEIEKQSKKQNRGAFSKNKEKKKNNQMSLFNS